MRFRTLRLAESLIPKSSGNPKGQMFKRLGLKAVRWELRVGIVVANLNSNP